MKSNSIKKDKRKSKKKPLSPFSEITTRPVDLKRSKVIPDFKENAQFKQNLKSLYKFCEQIKNENEKEKIQHMKNYTVIRAASIFENQLKSILVHFVDEHKILPSQILEDDTIPISLDDLDELKKEDITKGKILTSTFNVNIGTLAKCFGRINHVDFFNWVEEIIDKGKLRKEPWLYKEINKNYQRRNNLVHHLIDVDEDINTLRDDIKKWEKFVTLVYLVTVINIKMVEKEKEKQLDTICKKNLGMSLSDFEKIKYRGKWKYRNKE